MINNIPKELAVKWACIIRYYGSKHYKETGSVDLTDNLVNQIKEKYDIPEYAIKIAWQSFSPSR